MQIIVCKRMHLLPLPGNRAAKPKQCFRAKAGATKTLQQAARIMKLTALLLLGACLHVHAIGFGQKISLTEREAPIEKVFREIEAQSNYKFLYASHVIQDAKKVTLTIRDASIEAVLDLVFNGQNFGYRIDQNTVVVKPRVTIDNKPRLVVDESDPIDVRGIVTDNEGRPLPGANVRIKGSSIGTVTDNDGRFTLKNVVEGSVLEISFVGYEQKTFTVRGSGMVNIALGQKLSLLDETIVIAYGTTTRRFATGNVATVKAADIEKQPVQNPLLALQGRVPGIEVTQLSGMNGGGVQVRIQGNNSIASLGSAGGLKTGTDPLVVIDGVPYASQLYNSGMEAFLQGGSPLNYVNPADIESIDVLKDADATAIYGSRAANGAILITTKKGRTGRTIFKINLQQGWGKVGHFADMMNTRQYLSMRYEALRNAGIVLSAQPTNSSNYDLKLWDTTSYTDWQKVFIGGSAQYTNINVGVSGGTSNLQFLVGSTFNRKTTVFPGDFDDKVGGLHFNINGSSNDQRFKLQLTTSYTYDKNFLGDDLTSVAVKLEPDAPALYTKNGKLNWAQDANGNSSWINPLASSVSRDFNNTTKNLLTNLVLSYTFLKGLKLSSSFGYTDLRSDLYQPSRLEVERPERRTSTPRRATFGNRSMGSWIIEPQLIYTGKVAKGQLETLLGTTIQKSSSNSLTVTGSGFASDLLMKSLLFATSTTVNVSASEINRFNALFARVNYNLGSKYLINFAGRRDGSNKFGDANKFHNFWSIGAAWIFSEEHWLQHLLPALSFGKLRTSYGTTGNDQIPSFSYLSIYGINNPTILYQNNYGLQPAGIPNPHLQWEETRKWQAGIDLGLFMDRFIVGATYARNRSSNQLTGYILPELTGFGSITKNLPATVQNTSWEFTINAAVIKRKGFSWNSSANLTIPRNKIVSFPGIEFTAYASGTRGIIVGQPIGVLKGYQYAGIDPTSGNYLAVDVNGNYTSTPNPTLDNTKLISTQSHWYGGWLNSISYRGFQLDFLFQFVRKKGSKDLYYYNGSRYPGEFVSRESNQPTTVLNRWRKPGDEGPIAIYFPFDLGKSLISGSDVWYSYDASYIRLKNLSLSWQFPSNWLQKIHLKNVRLYFNGQNLVMLTNYTGLDPETMSVTSLPTLQMWTFGANIEF